MPTRPRPRTVALAAAALLAPLLVGSAVAAPSPKAPSALKQYPAPTVTGKQLADGVAAFSEGHPLRITGTPTQLQAVETLAAEARSLGLTVETTSYKGVLTSLTATKKGTDRADEHLVFGAHLDSMVGTITGAYDDASGVRMVMELARSFAKVPTHRTLVFSWYNGEEEGALGSAEMAADYKEQGKKVAAYLGFDMVGIAWPVAGPTTDENCLCIWRGARDAGLDALLRSVNHDFLKLPAGKQQVSLEGENVRNSDEASWADEGYRTVRWAGLRKAADYPQYHLPEDNMQVIDETAGGRSYFEKGMRNTLLSAYYTAAALDLQAAPAPSPVTVAEADRTAQKTVAHRPGDQHTH